MDDKCLTSCCGSRIERIGLFEGISLETANVLGNCIKCGNTIRMYELITIEEWKNIKRTKLIDRMI